MIDAPEISRTFSAALGRFAPPPAAAGARLQGPTARHLQRTRFQFPTFSLNVRVGGSGSFSRRNQTINSIDAGYGCVDTKR